MEMVRIDGVEYTKASIIAKRFRYTTDYIGQLCRSGKVACQLVGRSWYVSEEALLRHKDARYKEVRVGEIASISKSESTGTDAKIAVAPRLKGVTAKRLQTAHTAHFLSRVGAVESKYYADDEVLLPQPLRQIKPITPKQIVVETAEAVALPVIEKTKPQKLAFTPLPEVALTGKLKVADVVVDTSASPVVALSDLPEVTPSTPMPKTTVPVVTQESKSRATRANFTPVSVVTSRDVSRNHYLIPVALVSGLLLCTFINLASQLIVVERGEMSAAVVFSLEALRSLW